MVSARTSVERCVRVPGGFALLCGFLVIASLAWAQYPTSSQISKDGTAIFFKDWGPEHRAAASAYHANGRRWECQYLNWGIRS